MKMDKWLSLVSRVDYAIAVGTIGYGMWEGSGWWIAGGVGGLVMAWWGPARRASKWIEGYMVKRGVKSDDSAELERKEALYGGEGSLSGGGVVGGGLEGVRWDVGGVVGYGEVRLVNNRHNVLLKGVGNKWELSDDVKWS